MNVITVSGQNEPRCKCLEGTKCTQQQIEVSDSGQAINRTGDLCCKDNTAIDAKNVDTGVYDMQIPQHVYRRSKRGFKGDNKIIRFIRNLFPSGGKDKRKLSNRDSQYDKGRHRTDDRYENEQYQKKQDYQDRNNQRSDWRQSHQVHEDGRGQWLRDYMSKKQRGHNKDENESGGRGEWLRKYIEKKKNKGKHNSDEN